MPGNISSENAAAVTSGQRFPSLESLRAHTTILCCATGRSMKTNNNEGVRVTFRCATAGCKWKVCARATDEEDYVVTVCELHHITECAPHESTKVYGIKDSVAYLAAEKVRSLGSGYKKKHLVADMKALGLEISKDTAYRAISSADALINGDRHAGYSYLESWLTSLTENNPGTQWEIKEDGGRFKYLFLALASSIEGVKGCPPNFGVVDGCCTRGYYTGTFLTLLCVDPLGRAFPLAFGLIGNEDTESWEWFFTKAREAYGEEFFANFALMSDGQKGLLNAQRSALPNVSTLRCILHLENNIKHSLKASKEDVSGFERAAYALSEERHEMILKGLDKKLQDFLQKMGPESWALAHIKKRNYGHVTSNVAESFNASLGNMREKSILGMLNELITQMTRWFFDRSQEAAGLAGREMYSRSTGGGRPTVY